MKICCLVFLIYIASSIECSSSTTDHQKVGASSDIDVDDATLVKLLKEHVPRLDMGESGSLEIVEKTKATQQVVSGLIYQVFGKFKIGDRSDVECKISIWTRAWLTNDDKVKIKLECGDERFDTKNESSQW